MDGRYKKYGIRVVNNKRLIIWITKQTVQTQQCCIICYMFASQSNIKILE